MTNQEAIDAEVKSLPKPPSSRNVGFAGLDEQIIEKALITYRGDIFQAAASLGKNVRMFNLAIRQSTYLQKAALAIEQAAVIPEYEALTAKQFEAAIRERLTAYRIDGLDALHELATMSHAGDPEMAKVKLQAASKLAGTEEGQHSGASEMSDVLRALNDPEGMLRDAQVHEERADRLGAEREGDAARLRRRLDELDEERRRAQRLARKGLLTDGELADQLGEVARERAAVEAELADLLRAPLDAARLRNWAALLRDTAETWREAARVLGPVPADALDPDALPLPLDWRGLVRQFVERVVVRDDGSVGVEGVLTCPPSR